MSTNPKKSAIDILLGVLQTSNALVPAAIPGIAAVVGLIKQRTSEGKTPEEIEAEAADSMATVMRTRSKSEQQMGDQA